MPGVKTGSKGNFIRLTEQCDKLFQFDSGLKLGVIREITGYDLFLVEVTHLDRNIEEELPDAWPAIENDSLNRISHILQRFSSLPIYINGFAFDLMDVEVFLQMRSPYDQDTEAPFEEGDIGNDNDGLRIVVLFLYRSIV